MKQIVIVGRGCNAVACDIKNPVRAWRSLGKRDSERPAMTATYVIIALVIGVLTGAFVVWVAMRGQGQGQAPHGVVESQGEIKARLDETLQQVRQIGAIFTNASQRGRAGEFVLENLLEATGMDQHRDFDVQVGQEAVRPDVVLNLPGRGRLVIDAKFPLDDFQHAVSADREDDRRRALAAHARAVAGHVSALAGRDYPSKVKDAIDFTICFVPSEDLLAAAYDERPSLFYDAVRDRVLIATPATLVALLWGVAFGWQQDARVHQAQEIGEMGAELHKRLGTMAEHMQKLGKSLTSTVSAYNSLLGSLETRVLSQARRFEDLGILAHGSELPDLKAVDVHTRPISPGRYPAAEADLVADEALAEPGSQAASGGT